MAPKIVVVPMNLNSHEARETIALSLFWRKIVIYRVTVLVDLPCENGQGQAEQLVDEMLDMAAQSNHFEELAAMLGANIDGVEKTAE